MVSQLIADLVKPRQVTAVVDTLLDAVTVSFHLRAATAYLLKIMVSMFVYRMSLGSAK